MTDLPVLTTDRLTLRAFAISDAPMVAQFCSDRDIAANTATIPHPYDLGMAKEWITSQTEGRDKHANFAMTLTASGELVGSIGLKLALDQSNAELGYWIGKPYWNQGFATEGARAVLGYGFLQLKLHRIHAHCLSRNPSSGKVLEKIGMQHEGHLREHFQKWGRFQDLEMYGLLAREYGEKIRS